MTNVIVSRPRNVRVSTNATAGVLDTRVPVTIKNAQAGASAARLDHLLDVVAAGETDGATLVYQSNTDTYVVQKLDFANMSGDLDGGTF